MFDSPTVFSTKKKAEEKVAQKNAQKNEDGWKYIVETDPSGSGRAIIKVYDCDNVFVKYL